MPIKAGCLCSRACRMHGSSRMRKSSCPARRVKASTVLPCCLALMSAAFKPQLKVLMRALSLSSWSRCPLACIESPSWFWITRRLMRQRKFKSAESFGKSAACFSFSCRRIARISILSKCCGAGSNISGCDRRITWKPTRFFTKCAKLWPPSDRCSKFTLHLFNII